MKPKIKPSIDSIEIEEVIDFMEFLARTGRQDKLDEIDLIKKRTDSCVHIMRDFITTATQDHHKIKEHLIQLDNNYKEYREHALKCNRCQLSLDTIFTFTGYKNRKLFHGSDAENIIKAEWQSISNNDLYLCKILPGYNYDELTYITSISLSKALGQFEETIQKPLNLTNFSLPIFGVKRANNGKGISYNQAYLCPRDKRYRTKICIRSLER